MCGIVGIMSPTLTSFDVDKFTDLLEVGVLRGRDSTGLFSVNKKGTPFIAKAALPAGQWTDTLEYDKATSRAHDFIVGHNRWATVGKVDKRSAHPFKHGAITLVHNGTLTSTKNLEGDKQFSVDSEMIAYELSRHDSTEVLEKLNGAFALVWYDHRDKSLNFARNNRRPLWFGTRGGDTYFASEKMMLEWVLTRKVKTAVVYDELPVGVHLKFIGKDKPIATKFTPHVNYVISPRRGGFVGNNLAKKSVTFLVEELTGAAHCPKITGTTDDGDIVTGWYIRGNFKVGDVLEGDVISSNTSYFKGTRTKRITISGARHADVNALEYIPMHCYYCGHTITEEESAEATTTYGNNIVHGGCALACGGYS